jgi:two-component system response regulator HydG
MANILVIDDNETIREGIAAVIAQNGHKVHVAADGNAGLMLYKSCRIDMTICDLKMEGLDGLAVLRAILEIDENAVVMLITAYGTVETAVEAIKKGAFDFITKPFGADRLKTKIATALQMAQVKRERAHLEAENQILRQQLKPDVDFSSMVGESNAMQEVFSILRKVGPTDSSVLISGESGTGKELVARALHDLSHRSKLPFIQVNCGALVETLLESEMFGHEKGAFTNANRRKLGRFELAHQGTIFLDEIAEIGQSVQVKLLRVLQERQFERVGGEETIEVDVRVIAATNRDLQELVSRGEFREDLFYRLHIVPVHIPPLRERISDIQALCKHFLTKLAKRTGRNMESIEPEALEILSAYDWPGNVRELENVMEQAMVFAEQNTISTQDIPAKLCNRAKQTSQSIQTLNNTMRVDLSGRSLNDVLESVEEILIRRAFDKAEKIKTETARQLGIKTSALYYKLEKYNIQ